MGVEESPCVGIATDAIVAVQYCRELSLIEITIN